MREPKSGGGLSTVGLQFAGLAAFVAATVVLGRWLRRHPTKEAAERSSRVLHGMFFVGIVGPGLLGLVRPGPGRLDRLLRLPPLPARPKLRALGALLLALGSYLSLASNRALRTLGSGANAFRLTRRVVATDIYERTRNPMSLGYYLQVLGTALLAGSTYLTAGALLGVVPAHIFFLKYFEERELELRLGESYVEYRRRVPFLVPRLRGVAAAAAAGGEVA